MKILVTGSSGLVGKNLVEFLGMTHTVAGLSRSGSLQTRFKINLIDQVAVLHCLETFKPQVIVHAAAMTNVDECQRQEKEAYKQNVLTTKILCDWAADNGCKMVYISTDYVYPGNDRMAINDENSPVGPANHYGNTKLEAEKLVEKVPNHAILRTTSVFGFDPGGKNFLMQVIECRKSRKVPNDQINNPTDVLILCEYIGRVISKDLRGLFNATGPQTISREQFMHLICSEFDIDPLLFKAVPTSELDQKAKRPLNCSTDSRKLWNNIDYLPPSLQESISRIKHESESVVGITKKIYDLVKQLHSLKFATKSFVPGTSVLNPTNKVFDVEEMVMGTQAVLDGWWTEGRFAKEFEKKLAEFTGATHVSLTNSGSSANLVAFMSLTSHLLKKMAIKPGDEVITAATGFPTTVNPIIQSGCVPVLLDANSATLNADTSYLEEAVTDKTKAIMLAHMLGNPFDLEKVMKVASENGLWVIEDSCDALGATWNGKLVGTYGDMGTFSFYPAHQMTMGEGGAVITSNSIMHKVNDSIRDWGRDCWCDPGKDNTCGMRFSQPQNVLGCLPCGYDHKYVYSHLGYNLKLTDMQAGIGLAQLKKMEGFIQVRRANHAAILSRLGKYSHLLAFQTNLMKAEPSWFGFALTLKDGCGFTRKELIDHLDLMKVNTRTLFGGNLIRQPYFIGKKYRTVGELVHSDYIMNNTLWVSCDPSLTGEKLDYLCSAFDEFLKKR